LTLLVSIVAARLLGREAFGELGMLQSTVAMFGVFGGFGLGLTSAKHTAEYRDRDPARAGRLIILSTVVVWVTGFFASVAVLILAPLLAREILHAPHLTALLRLSAPLAGLGAVIGAQTGTLTGFEAFKAIAKVNLVAGLISFPITVSWVLLEGLEGAIWALVVSSIIMWLLNGLALKHQIAQSMISPRAGIRSGDWSILWNYSVPTLLSSVMVVMGNWLAGVVLVNRPNGYSEMGIFNAANQWFGLVFFVPNMVSQALQPVVSERYGMGDIRAVRQGLNKCILVLGCLAMPVALVGCAISPLLMSLYGPGYRGRWLTLAFAFLAAGAFSSQEPVGALLFGIGKAWLAFFFTTCWAMTFLVGALLLVRFGSEGLAGARLAAYSLNAVWCFVTAHHLLGALPRHSVNQP
jgi:O-antigen/teichoic acid export membrane protein